MGGGAIPEAVGLVMFSANSASGDYAVQRVEQTNLFGTTRTIEILWAVPQFYSSEVAGQSEMCPGDCCEMPLPRRRPVSKVEPEAKMREG